MQSYARNSWPLSSKGYLISVLHLPWQRASMYNSHLWGLATLKPIVEHSAGELLLPALKTNFMAGIRTANILHSKRTFLSTAPPPWLCCMFVQLLLLGRNSINLFGPGQHFLSACRGTSDWMFPKKQWNNAILHNLQYNFYQNNYCLLLIKFIVFD